MFKLILLRDVKDKSNSLVLEKIYIYC